MWSLACSCRAPGLVPTLPIFVGGGKHSVEPDVSLIMGCRPWRKWADWRGQRPAIAGIEQRRRPWRRSQVAGARCRIGTRRSAAGLAPGPRKASNCRPAPATKPCSGPSPGGAHHHHSADAWPQRQVLRHAFDQAGQRPGRQAGRLARPTGTQRHDVPDNAPDDGSAHSSRPPRAARRPGPARVPAPGSWPTHRQYAPALRSRSWVGGPDPSRSQSHLLRSAWGVLLWPNSGCRCHGAGHGRPVAADAAGRWTHRGWAAAAAVGRWMILVARASFPMRQLSTVGAAGQPAVITGRPRPCAAVLSLRSKQQNCSAGPMTPKARQALANCTLS